MEVFRKRMYRYVAILICGLMVNIFVASLLLAKWDASVYPGNLYAGPIYLGNMTRAGALHKLQDYNTAASLSIDCIVGQDIYQLKLMDLGVKLDAKATIEKIDSQIGRWSLLEHSLKRGKKLMIPPIWEYDYDRLRQSLNNLAVSKFKEPVDAGVMLVGDCLLHRSEQYGAQIIPDLAVDSLIATLNEDQLKVVLPEKTISPNITRSQITNIEELLSVQAVPIGSKYQAASEASWAVPGRIVLPGKSIPIDLMLDASAENGQELVANWQEALSRAAEEAGLVYKVTDQELLNPTDQPVALFITRDKELGLIRIYGTQKNSEPKITISRTFRPLLTSSATAGEPEKSMSGEIIYRHRFVDGQLRATERLEYSAVAAFGHKTGINGITPSKHK